MNTIKFKSDEIIPMLSMVSSIVNPKSTIPILTNVRLKTKDEGKMLELMASDSETWLKFTTPIIEADNDVCVCVDAKALLNALTNLSDKEITLEVNDENNTVTCTYDNGYFSLPKDSVGDFPLPMLDENGNSEVSINVSNLLTAIERAGFANGNSATRPIINGVHFDFRSDGMVCVTTDGNRLAKYVDLTVCNEVGNFTMPKKPSSVLVNVLSNTYAGDVKISFNDNYAIISNNQFVMYARLIFGNYPNYNRVIPTDNNIEVAIDKNNLLTALKRVMPMGNTQSEMVTFVFENGKVTLSAENAMFGKKASESVDCDYQGEPFMLSFKGSYFAQMVKSIEGEMVKISLKSKNTAGLFTEFESNPVYVYSSILMPMATE